MPKPLQWCIALGGIPIGASGNFKKNYQLPRMWSFLSMWLEKLTTPVATTLEKETPMGSESLALLKQLNRAMNKPHLLKMRTHSNLDKENLYNN